MPDEEFATLGCNVLAVRPGVVVVADGNPHTRRALEAAGCEVHAFEAAEIGLNGGGGPTCLTRPILPGLTWPQRFRRGPLLSACRSRVGTGPTASTSRTAGRRPPRPLVLQLHGRGGGGPWFDRMAGFVALAEPEGFVLAAPDAVDGVWSDGRFAAGDRRGIARRRRLPHRGRG